MTKYSVLHNYITMKLLIVVYYDIREFFLAISKAFMQYGFEIDYYPLYKFAYDTNEKRSDYKFHMVDYVLNSKSDYILWWFIDIPVEDFVHIKNNIGNTKIIVYNSDDPFNFNPNMIEKLKDIFMIGSNCNQNINSYKGFCYVKECYFIPMGYSNEYFHPLDDKEISQLDIDEYKCDISVICTTLYEKKYFPNQIIERKTLYENISKYCEINNKTFYIYGPPHLMEIFPSNYRGDLPYIKQNMVFNLSKINLCTRADKNADVLTKDFELRILGAGGLLMIDNCMDTLGFFKDKYNCVTFNCDNYIDHIDDILNNYSDFIPIKNQGLQFSKNYTWDKFACKIYTSISKHNFDGKFYVEINNLDISINDAWTHWIHHGMDNKLICHKIKAPNDFLSDDYKKDTSVDFTDVDMLYTHWYIKSKDDIYINKDDNSYHSNGNFKFNINDLKLTTEDLFELFKILNDLRISKNKNICLDKLSSFIGNRPYIKFNKLLDLYFSFV